MRVIELDADKPGPVRGLAFAPGGRTFLAATAAEVLVCDAATGEPVAGDAAGWPPGAEYIPEPAWSADLRTLARVRSADVLGAHEIEVLALGPRPDRVRLRFPAGDWIEWAVALAVSPDGSRVAAAQVCDDHGSWVRVWDVAAARARAGGEDVRFDPAYDRADVVAQRSLACAAYAPTGREWAVGGPWGVTRIDLAVPPPDLSAVAEGQEPPEGYGEFGLEPAHVVREGYVRRLAYAPDGAGLAAAADDGAYAWAGRGADAVALGRGPASEVAWHPDGLRVAVARATKVEVWDAAAGRRLAEYAWKVGEVLSVAFAPDGLTCAAGGARGRVVVWDIDG